MGISDISNATGVNYSTVRTIIRDFRLNGGRVKRLLNFVSKKSLMRKKQAAYKNPMANCPNLSLMK